MNFMSFSIISSSRPLRLRGEKVFVDRIYNDPPMSYLYPKRNTLPLFQIILLAALGIAAGLSAAFIFLAPRVTAVAPAENGRTGLYAAVEIQFSAPMRAECTADHFSVEPAVEGDLAIEGNTLRFTPRNPWPAGAGVRATILAGACSERGLPLLAGRTWTFTPSLLRVAYLPTGGEDGRLMAVPADGGDPEILARTSEPFQSFDISRRGDFAVLSTGAYGYPGRLWLSRLDGNTARLLLDCGEDSCSDPVISPDGSLAAYVRRGFGSAAAAPFIELLTLSSGRTRTVSTPGNTTGNPFWSAQGWLSYYDGTRRVIVIDDLAGGQTVIPNTTGAAWSWLPDGSAIIFPEISVEEVTDRETATRIISFLFRVDVKTNTRANLSGTEMLEDASPSVSPDGLRLAFSRNFFDARWTPGNQLWIMDLADGSARQVSQAPDYSHSSIHWSPDGTRLVYMLFHETLPSDPPEIWCLNADGSDPRRLAVGGFLPQWIP
jgi:Tol biopolymer transport system component